MEKKSEFNLQRAKQLQAFIKQKTKVNTKEVQEVLQKIQKRASNLT